MASKRIALWDNVKFLLIMSVVIGHFVDLYSFDIHSYKSIFLFIYSFHMPLFIFISGLFHKNDKIATKVISFVAIGFTLKVVFYVTKTLIPGKEGYFEVFTEDGLPWFMFAMAVFILLTYLLRNVNKLYILFLFIGIACFAGFDPAIGDFLSLSRIIVYYPFYLLGTVVNRKTLEGMATKKSIKAISIGILVVWVILCFKFTNDIQIFRHLFTGRNAFDDSIYPYGPLYRLATYGMEIVIGFSFIMAVPTRRIGFITPFGSKTLQVYFWHNILRNILMAFSLNTFLLSYGRPGRIAWVCLAIPLTYLCCIKPFSFPTDQLLKLPVIKKPDSEKVAVEKRAEATVADKSAGTTESPPEGLPESSSKSLPKEEKDSPADNKSSSDNKLPDGTNTTGK